MKPHDFKTLVEFRARVMADISPDEPDPDDWNEGNPMRILFTRLSRASILAEIAAGVIPCPAEATSEMAWAALDADQFTGPKTVNAATAASPFLPREEADDER